MNSLNFMTGDRVRLVLDYPPHTQSSPPEPITDIIAVPAGQKRGLYINYRRGAHADVELTETEARVFIAATDSVASPSFCVVDNDEWSLLLGLVIVGQAVRIVR